MRDGIHLHSVLYLPQGNWPISTLLLRTPFGSGSIDYTEWGAEFVKSGYAVVLQDVRGRNNSGGKCNPYVQEINDGYDTHEWIGNQNWCDGNIGTFGISYSGFTQILPAHLNSRFVKALVPVGNQSNNYGHLRYNGVLQLENVINWIWWGNKNTQHVNSNLIDWDKLYKKLPLINAIEDICHRPYYKKIIINEKYNKFWEETDISKQYNKVKAPAFFITGWYDNLLNETFKNFCGWVNKSRSKLVKSKTKLLVGPWYHYNFGMDTKFGDISFGPKAKINLVNEQIRWFDKRLKNIDNGIDLEPPIKLFIMGANSWRDEYEWPLKRTKYERLFFHSHGHANSLNGDGYLSKTLPGYEGQDTYRYDPEDPVPTTGGQGQYQDTSGPKDRSKIELRNDILVYSSEVLCDECEITGSVEINLYAASSAKDTDFTATLVDVYPDGRAINISEGIVRAKFRNSYSKPTLIKPNKIYLYKILIWETSNLFKKNHRIRIEISSSNFPRFDRNLNSGRVSSIDDQPKICHQQIFHNKNHPSNVILPVIPVS